MHNVPLENCAKEVFAWVQAGIEFFFPSFSEITGENTIFSSFTPAVSPAIAYKNHFFLLRFVCFIFADRLRHRIVSNRFCSREY